MAQFGKVTAVTEEPVGTTLAVAAVVGDTTITVDDVSKLAWPAGGLQIGDDETNELRIYTIADAASEDVDTIDSDDDEDVAEGIVNLFTFVGPPALVNGYDVDTPVIQYPQVTEKIATVQLPDQEEELVLRVPQQLTDRLTTDIRVDLSGTTGTSETVELEESESEYVITDVIGEEGTGLSRGYAEVAGPLSITSTDDLNPDVVATVSIEIPTEQHRVIFSYFAELTAATGQSLSLGFDDAGFDFAVGELDIAIHNDVTSAGPHDALPLLPAAAQDTPYVRVGGISVTAGLQALPTNFMPYTVTPPTPGLHTFRLVAYVSGGTGTVANAHLWATVI